MTFTPEPLFVGEVGSTAYEVDVVTSDRDLMGVFVEAPESLLGNAPGCQTVTLRDAAAGERSSAGDTETVLHSLRKFAAQIASGSPTYLPLLFTQALTTPDKLGVRSALRSLAMSKSVIGTHLGYADSHLGLAVDSSRGSGSSTRAVRRPELVAEYGFDTKAASHAIRALIQARELITFGWVTMPLDEPDRELVLSVRRGEIPLDQVVDLCTELASVVKERRSTSDALPNEADLAELDRWLVWFHLDHWSRTCPGALLP